MRGKILSKGEDFSISTERKKDYINTQLLTIIGVLPANNIVLGQQM